MERAAFGPTDRCFLPFSHRVCLLAESEFAQLILQRLPGGRSEEGVEVVRTAAGLQPLHFRPSFLATSLDTKMNEEEKEDRDSVANRSITLCY